MAVGLISIMTDGSSPPERGFSMTPALYNHVIALRTEVTIHFQSNIPILFLHSHFGVAVGQEGSEGGSIPG